MSDHLKEIFFDHLRDAVDNKYIEDFTEFTVLPDNSE